MMTDKSKDFTRFFILTGLALGVYWLVETYWFPPKPVPPPPPRSAKKDDLIAALGGGGAPDALIAVVTKKLEPPKPVEVKPAEPRSLIALGDESFYLKVLLTNKGGGVQQVVLTRFDEASRLGREILDDGKPRPLHLIPGFDRPWSPFVEIEPPLVPLAANVSAADRAPKKFTFDDKLLTRPSYVLLHYPSRDDPGRRKGDDGQPLTEDDSFPLAELGDRHWTIAAIEQPADGDWKVVFETELPAPYFLKLK